VLRAKTILETYLLIWIYLSQTENLKPTKRLIVKVLVHLDEIDFDLENTDSDVLGDAYEYLIGQFASGAGKKAGEFYTPQQVVSWAQIVTAGKDQLKSVYVPLVVLVLCCCVCQRSQERQCFGQEMNPTTYNLCRMNDYARCALQAFRYQERRHLRATATFECVLKPLWLILLFG
jgi:type I restriction-modification system DNA methylase subunit